MLFFVTGDAGAYGNQELAEPVLPAAAASNSSAPSNLVKRMASCTSCHGKHGQGGDNGFNPRLAGKPALYLYHQLLNFRTGKRHYPMMQHMVTGLPDAYLREMADYFAALDTPFPPPAEPTVPPSVLAHGRDVVEHGDPARKVPACEACHGKRLTGMEPGIPALIGLPRDYISNQIGAWRNGQRNAIAPDCMSKVAKRLSTTDIVAVSAWLASRPIPANTRPAPEGAYKLPLKCGSEP